jgi:hypothetical protein
MLDAIGEPSVLEIDQKFRSSVLSAFSVVSIRHSRGVENIHQSTTISVC